jgi:hypothetical protein
MPPLYGVAWVGFVTNTATCLPVPLNLVAAVVRGLYLAARYSDRAIAADPRAAYRQGLRDRVDRDEVVQQLRADLDEACALLREIAEQETVQPEPGTLIDRVDDFNFRAMLNRRAAE